MSLYSQQLYRVELNNVCGGIVVTGNVVTEAAPVFEKFIGAKYPRFKEWVERKGGTVRKGRITGAQNEQKWIPEF
jgi:hypothetical protein